MQSWGLSDPRIEPWGTFGRGWVNEKLDAQVTSRVPFAVIGYPGRGRWAPTGS
jgi:hypothetical protein